MTDAAERSPSGAPTADALVFAFQHKLFSAKGCVFRKTAEGGIALHFPLGDITAALSPETIRASFDIKAGCADDELMKQVGKALRFVREVRPGDSIPQEIVDGRASWMVEEKYLLAAKARISVQLVSWLRGQDMRDAAPEELIAAAEAPEMRQTIQEAFTTIAQKLGYAPERREEVVDLIGRLAQEFSYVEALRDRFARVRRIMAMLKSLGGTYRRERGVQEIIVRCNVLLNKPTQRIFDVFREIEANTGEVLQTLRNYDTQVAYVRKKRDELREMYLLWEKMIETWDACDGSACPATERLIRDTYRFAAQNFTRVATWTECAA